MRASRCGYAPLSGAVEWVTPKRKRASTLGTVVRWESGCAVAKPTALGREGDVYAALFKGIKAAAVQHRQPLAVRWLIRATLDRVSVKDKATLGVYA